MNRCFEKISFNQFQKDTGYSNEYYYQYGLPLRSTKNSAGYDFKAINDITIKANESVMIPTGIKALMQSDEVLLVIIRSSMALKNGLNLLNQTGVIDSDYYNNPTNEGHIYIPIINNGSESYTIQKGDRFAQGIFTKFLIIDNEREVAKARNGGFGSTNKGEDINEQ